jgi:hypothetical protein
MASLQAQGNTTKLTSKVGSISRRGGTDRFNTSTVLSTPGVGAGFAQAAGPDGLNVGINIIGAANDAQNVANVLFPSNGGPPKLNPTAAFSSLPSGLQTVIGAGGASLAKNSIQGAMADTGLVDKTPLAANAAAAATDAVPGALGAVSAPSPGGAAAAASSGGGLRYPKDMVDTQDHIIFTAEEDASYPGPVILGIQPQINDSNAVEWGGSALNEIQRRVVKAIAPTLDPTKQLGPLLEQLPGKLAQQAKYFMTGKESGEMIKLFFLEQALSLQGLSARNEFNGAIINPNLELVFTSPTLRPFSFTFRMTPREKTESDNIRKIIRFFKQNMAPRKKGDFVLKRPPYFTIEYKGAAANSGSLNLIKKQCALTNCSVDYTPDGSYMTYQPDGAMTAYSLTLQFQEVSPLYDQDYIDLGNTNIIGY